MPTPDINTLSKMIMRRIQYDQMRHKVIHDYIQKRQDGLRRAHKDTYRRLDEQTLFASERGEFWLEVVRRDIMRDLDDLALDLESIDIDGLDDLDTIRASDERGAPRIFSKSPDFFSSFDIFK